MKDIIRTLGIIEEDSVEKEELQETQMNRYLEKGDILFVERLEPNEEFEGVVFCLKTYTRPNIYNTAKWDSIFRCIDGEGVRFTAAFYDMDIKFEEHTGPMFIRGIKYYASDANGSEVLRYRLNYVTQTRSDYPKSMFLKYIEGYVSLKEQFKAKVLDTIQEGRFASLYQLVDKQGLSANIYEEPLADRYGTMMGTKMKFFLSASSIVEALDVKEDSKELILMALLLKLWNPTDEIEGQEVPGFIVGSFLTTRAIMESTIDKLDKLKLLSILQNKHTCIEAELTEDIFCLLQKQYRLKDTKDSVLTSKLGLYM